MTYSNAQMEIIKACVGNLMKISDIAALIEVDEDDLKLDILDKFHPVSKLYRQIKAKTIFEMRTAEIQLAKAGSPLAVQMVNEYIKDMEDEEFL